MFDQREFIERMEAANVEEFAELLARPTPEQEAALRAYFGPERYRSLRGLLLRGRTRAGSEAKEGNVVVLHGIMGGELSTGSSRLWLRIPRIIFGGLRALRLSPDGKRDADAGASVTASGILKQYYGELLLYLSGSWNVKAFFYDWRRDLNETAALLNEQLPRWFGEGAPVHLVAHSMGGLLARTFILNHGDRWASMWDAASGGRRGGRLVMLGTPNHGSYSIPQVLTGLSATVQKLARADITHDLRGLLQIFSSFPGLYQLMPSPLRDVEAERLYEAQTYPGFPVAQLHLNGAREHYRRLQPVVDPKRMLYVAGYNQATLDGVDPQRVGDAAAYRFTAAGDGSVTHKLGLLEGVTTYYVQCEHADLSANRTVLPIVDSLLRVGATKLLTTTPPIVRGAAEDQAELRQRWEAAQAAEVERAERLSARLAGARGRALDESQQVPQQEVELARLLSTGILGQPPQAVSGPVAEPVRSGPATAPFRIRVEFGRIETLRASNGVGPVDAVSVGHYRGVRPVAAERDLGRAISPRPEGASADPDEPDLVTELTDRGTFRGDLGQSFVLPFPRAAGAQGTAGGDCLLALCGLGEPGRLGIPELTVAVRELVWALGRLGRRHLASVLIGGGAGNLPVRDAVAAWLSGIASARRGDARHAGWLTDLTFVEADLGRLRRDLLPALEQEIRRFNQRCGETVFAFSAPGGGVQEAWQAQEAGVLRPTSERGQAEAGEVAPTIITVTCDQQGRYRFGALTDKASIPERELTLSAHLVQSANQELASEADPDLQLERGQLLHGLLVPDDLRSQFSSTGPLVLVVDPISARLHWEMMAQPDGGLRSSSQQHPPAREDMFFGTARGLTRRLRTTRAPAPEPPTHPARTLRVLVVADPAADRRLPAAEREGFEVAALFDAFNSTHGPGSRHRVEVKTLLGPNEATPTNVLRELMVRQYDVLHFAGHCFFDKANPQASGWIFGDGRTLTALELNRIDRVPLFVFSNACESGVTADPSPGDASALAPSFAEAFFARGVANFVCTAWQIDDTTARQFALRLYAALLGIDLEAFELASDAFARDDGGTRSEDRPPLAAPFCSMTEALRLARMAVFSLPGGERTWGAYQHYGNPHYRFFRTPPTSPQPRAARAPTTGAPTPRPTPPAPPAPIADAPLSVMAAATGLSANPTDGEPMRFAGPPGKVRRR
jgi:hypothetical protein